MSLTKKNKEEIKELIREVIGESRSKTIDSEGTENYMDMFDKWATNSIDIFSNDIVGADEIELAPEDFVLKEDFRLKDGTILRKGKRYFTYDEAMALEEELFKPNGWGLPTTQEFMILHATYGLDENGKDNMKAFLKALNLEPQGYISSEDMAEYNKDPENFEKNGGTVVGRTTLGNWWSRNASSSTDANYLDTYVSGTSGYVFAQDSYYRGDGMSVRCVAR